MSLYKRGGVWWYSFIFAGKRIQESAKTSRKTVATESEKNRRLELEKALAGMPVEDRTRRIRSVSDLVRPYLAAYRNNHRPKSVLFAEGRLKHVEKHLGATMLTDLTEERIQAYISIRCKAGVSGRTINMELGELSRAVGKPWSILWPAVRKLEEEKDVGRALSPEEERKILDTLPRIHSPLFATIVRIALLTGMRCGEILDLCWSQVDFEGTVLTVGKAKSESGTRRQIPMNPTLLAVFSAHASWYANRFLNVESGRYLFPFGSPTPNDPTRHVLDIKTAWKNLRTLSGVKCRFHDLRHTVATKMAENGVPESTMLALLGHMSRQMLERYSHIRMTAKRSAMDGITLPDLTVTPVEDTKGPKREEKLTLQ
jgi:integrase